MRLRSVQLSVCGVLVVRVHKVCAAQPRPRGRRRALASQSHAGRGQALQLRSSSKKCIP